MALTDAEKTLLILQVEASGGSDIAKINGLMNQLGSEMRGVTQISEQQRRALVEAQEDLARLASRYATGSKEAQDLARAQAQLRTHLSNADRAAAQAAREAEKLAEAERKAAQAAQEMGEKSQGGFTRLQAGITTLSSGLSVIQQVAQAALQLGKITVGASAEYEQSLATYTQIFKGNVDQAKAFLQDLSDFAARTPFEFKGLQQQGQMLLNFGFAAKDVIPILTAVGDAAGGQQEKIDRLVTAIGQMRAKGKVSAEEMNQLAEAGVPAWELLAKSIGVSIPEAMARASKGGISAAEGLPALLKGMQDRFGGAMDEQSKTLTGKWSNTTDNLQQISRLAGDKISSALNLKGSLDWANDWLGKAKQLLEGKGTGASWLDELKSKLQSLEQQARPILQNLSRAMSDAFTAGKDVWEHILKPTWDAILPKVREVGQGIMPLLVSLSDFVRGAFAGLKNLIHTVLIPAWQEIQPVVSAVLTAVLGIVRQGMDLLGGILRSAGKLLSGDWKGAWEEIKTTVQNVIPKLGEILTNLNSAIDKKAVELANRMKSFGADMVDKFLAGFDSLESRLFLLISQALVKAVGAVPDVLAPAFAAAADKFSQMALDAQRGATAANDRVATRNLGPVTGIPPINLGPLDMNNPVVAATFSKTGNHEADDLLGWCARWVKLTLDKAQPNAKAKIDQWFAGDANNIKDRMAGAGLLRKDLNSLQAGDVVVYDKNHVGIYIGNGMVRGNNQWGVTQGRGVVSNEGLRALGGIAGYVRLSDVTGRPLPVSTPQPTNKPQKYDFAGVGGEAPPAADNKAAEQLAAMQTQYTKLTTQYKAGKLALDDYKSAVSSLLSKAEALALTQKEGSKEWNKTESFIQKATAALKLHEQGVSKYGQIFDDLKHRLDVADNLQKLGQDATPQFKKIEQAAKSAADAEKARNGETEKYRQLLGLAADAHGKLASIEKKDASEAEKRAKEQAKLRAQIADATRQLSVSAAQQALDKITELDRQELAAFTGTATERKALIERQQKDELAAKERVAAATRDKTIADAKADTTLGETVKNERIRQANETYAQTMRVAKGAQADQLRSAKEAVTQEGEAVRSLLERYAAARQALSDKAAKGDLTADDMADYAKQLAGLWEAAGKAGLKALPQIKAAHNAAKGFADTAIDQNAGAIERVAGQYDNLADTASRAAAGANKLQVSTEDVVSGLPQARSEWDSYVQVMRDLERQGLLAAGSVDALLKKIRELDTAAQNEQIVIDLTVQAMNKGIDPNSPDPLLQHLLGADQGGAGEQANTNALDLFGIDPEQVVEMGRQLGQDFIDSVAGGLSAEDFSSLGTDYLSGLAVALDGKPEWAKVREAILKGLDLSQAVDQTAQDITAHPENYRDGGRDKTPSAVPINRFKDFQGSIFEQADKLRTDSAFGDWLASELDKARQAGQLTDDQLQILKATLQEIRSGGPVLPPDLDEDRFKAMSDRVDALVRGFESGETSSKDFTKQVFDLLPVLDRMALAADAAGKPEIAENYRKQAAALAAQVPAADAAAYSMALLSQAKEQLADAMGMTKRPFEDTLKSLRDLRGQAGVDQAELEKLIAAFERLQATTEKQQAIQGMVDKLQTFQKYALQAIPAVTGAMQVLGGMAEDQAAAWGESLSSMVNDVVNFATSIAKGDYLGAAIGAITAIFTQAAREAAAYRAEMKKTADYNKQFKFSQTGYDTRTVTTSTAGFLFWKKTTYHEEIDEMKRDLALSIEGAVTNGFHSGFAEAAATGNTSAITKTVYTNLKDVALKALVDGFLGSAPVIALMGPMVEKLLDAFKSGDKARINQALSEFKSGLAQLQPEIETLAQAGKEITATLTDAAGEGSDVVSSWRQSLMGGVQALLSGQSPLTALYSGVRDRIAQALQDGLMVKRIIAKLDPLFEQIDNAISNGLDPSTYIAQIGAALPGLSVEMQTTLGPIMNQLAAALGGNTAALLGNTAALKESQFQNTTLISYGEVQGGSRMRQRLGGI